MMIRGCGGIQLFPCLSAKLGGSVEATKFMDKLEAQFMNDARRYLEILP
jgi:hypothetical protein